jgi:hypothetical protein
MALKTIYDNQDDIPEQYRDLFTERNGKWELTGIEGIKTPADVERVQTALNKERDEHKKTKDKLALFNDLDPEEVHAQLDRLPELEAAAGDKLDEAKIEEIVEGRIRTKLAPVERERDRAIKERDEAKAEADTARNEIRSRDIKSKVMDAAVKGKVVDTALDDVIMLAERVFEVNEDGTVTAKDGMGVTPGVDPAAWLQEMQERRPHWWPASEGGGAGGGGGGGSSTKNPWKKDQWNMTEQGRLFRENPENAERLAKLAGTTVGGPMPAS